MADRRRLSKFLSLILRHRAQDFGLTLDREGFTELTALREVVKQHAKENYSDEDWQAVLNDQTDGKKRFEVVDGRIRALYGHSKVSPVEYPPVEPPKILYHGTNPQALESIRRQGLRSMKRQYVHLSRTVERARKVGSRRTEQVILLTIKASDAYHSGISFYNPDPEHFLAKAIPPDFIVFP
jgi:putative RNA 2'-phosphotransferase